MVDVDGNMVVFPAKCPVNSLSSVNIVWGAESLSLNLTDGAGNNMYDILKDEKGFQSRVVWQATGVGLVQGTTIVSDLLSLRGSKVFTKLSYNAGYASVNDIPDSIKEATGLYVADMLRKRTNPTGASRIRQGGIDISYDRGGKSDLVTEAERLLQPYKRII
jgi:hypothetical protein